MYIRQLYVSRTLYGLYDRCVSRTVRCKQASCKIGYVSCVVRYVFYTFPCGLYAFQTIFFFLIINDHLHLKTSRLHEFQSISLLKIITSLKKYIAIDNLNYEKLSPYRQNPPGKKPALLAGRTCYTKCFLPVKTMNKNASTRKSYKKRKVEASSSNRNLISTKFVLLLIRMHRYASGDCCFNFYRQRVQKLDGNMTYL